ncbi:hypothetical protein WA026_014478 [Henosepilachna vigintioctopunctata]|uniref:Uncharacterized protein n=1 Tax=Henosepilachna vigintioctopunctata TaxID=420089 RepID=A0AAW1UIS7_9CUCU
MFSLYIVLCAVTVAVFANEAHHAPAHYKFDYGVHDPILMMSNRNGNTETAKT